MFVGKMGVCWGWNREDLVVVVVVGGSGETEGIGLRDLGLFVWCWRELKGVDGVESEGGGKDWWDWLGVVWEGIDWGELGERKGSSERGRVKWKEWVGEGGIKE